MKKGGKKRALGGGMKPQLSLSETSELVAEVAQWREELACCTAQLSILQQEFCEAVWRIDSFCQGLASCLLG